jgi:hypothetical protein
MTAASGKSGMRHGVYGFSLRSIAADKSSYFVVFVVSSAKQNSPQSFHDPAALHYE